MPLICQHSKIFVRSIVYSRSHSEPRVFTAAWQRRPGRSDKCGVSKRSGGSTVIRSPRPSPWRINARNLAERAPVVLSLARRSTLWPTMTGHYRTASSIEFTREWQLCELALNSPRWSRRLAPRDNSFFGRPRHRNDRCDTGPRGSGVILSVGAKARRGN